MAYDTEIDVNDDTGYGTHTPPQTVENTDSTPAETAAEGNDNDDATEGNDGADDSTAVNDDDATTGETDAGDGTDGEGEGGEPEQKPSRARDRIKQLVDERKELEAKLAKYENATDPADNTTAEGSYTDTGGPDITQYDISSDEGINEYLKACDDYAIDKAVNEKIAIRDRELSEATKTQQLTDEYTRAFERNPQFKDDMSNLVAWMDDKPVTADPSLVLQGADLMDVIAEVAGNSDLYYQLADMTETQQYAEYGKIHARLRREMPDDVNESAPPKNANRVKTGAPKPPNHTKGNAPTKRNPYAVSDDDFLASRGLT